MLLPLQFRLGSTPILNAAIMIGYNCAPEINYGKKKFAFMPDSNLTVPPGLV